MNSMNQKLFNLFQDDAADYQIFKENIKNRWAGGRRLTFDQLRLTALTTRATALRTTGTRALLQTTSTGSVLRECVGRGLMPMLATGLQMAITETGMA